MWLMVPAYGHWTVYLLTSRPTLGKPDSRIKKIYCFVECGILGFGIRNSAQETGNQGSTDKDSGMHAVIT